MLMAVQLPDGLDGRIEELRKLARANLPLGEIARRMQASIEDIRTAAEALHISIIRDNQTGGPRVRLACRESASAYTAQLRAARLAQDEHRRRIAKATPLSPAEEQAAIEKFLATKGATKCPTAYAEGASGESGLSPSRRVTVIEDP